ncbi:hypothetical protein [Mycobacterium spongiae]|uniref:hypothetical protein n=1 Tax=Mycobacterium spongiae TaxID=886343 RepID=UPI003CCE99E9
MIRRAPSGPLPANISSETSRSPRPEGATRIIRRETAPASSTDQPHPRTAVAASAVSILSGWTTSAVATDLIAGWWSNDRLFCIAVGFLTLVFAVATVTGVIMVLLRRRAGRYLIVTGALVALVTYGAVAVAGTHVAGIVYALPALPLASVVLSLHPRTKRWLEQ